MEIVKSILGMMGGAGAGLKIVTGQTNPESLQNGQQHLGCSSMILASVSDLASVERKDSVHGIMLLLARHSSKTSRPNWLLSKDFVRLFWGDSDIS